MSEINGVLSGLEATRIQGPVEQLLLDMLKQAGQTTSIAIVAIGQQGQITTAFAGGQRGDMYVGAGMLSQRLLADIMAPPKPGQILRPRL